MKKLRTAIIGAGGIARDAHIPAYAKLDSVELVALCTSREETAKAMAAKTGIPAWYTDHAAMLAAEKPDIVSVCTPNALHHPMVMDALRAGCHVYCEKPPALSYAQALEMHQTAEKYGRALAYNFNVRFSGQAQALRAVVQQGQLGRVYAGRLQALRRRGIPGWGVFTNKALQGGGALIDIGCHILDTAFYLLDYPTPVYVAAGSYDFIGKQGGIGQLGAWDGAGFTVEDSLFGFMRFENGMTLTLETAFALNMDLREGDLFNLALFGDKAGATMRPAMLHKTVGEVQVDEVLTTASPNPHDAAVADFVNAVAAGTEPLVPSGKVLLTQRVIDALYQSAESGRPVMME